MPTGTVVFSQSGTFEAAHAAEQWLRDRGFSYGPSQADGPQAVWHGDCVISKWRNLSAKDKRKCHATLSGDGRDGPMRITLCAAATPEAIAAFALPDAPEARTTADLILPVKREYFEQMCDGTKKAEYRLCTPYWLKRLQGRKYDRVVVTMGYPKRDDTERRLVVPYRGYTMEVITHAYFGPDPVSVFAIIIDIELNSKI
ncbi:hypothetical protein [Massilia sp. TSP1-1-2]|uniref:hypothetical protein n=1 Tax=Massilia sp. TSP1-1-2 TaxID=2804649 RepID=UPI003CEADB7D